MSTLSETQITEKLRRLPGWQLTSRGGKREIQKTFQTGNFLNGLGFLTRIAVLAEHAHHHPEVELSYPRLTLHLTSHEAHDLTEEDFELANRIEGIEVRESARVGSWKGHVVLE